MNLKIFLRPYEATITLFYALCIFSFYLMWTSNELIWLFAMPIAGTVNHFFFSLNHRMIAHKAFKARNELIHKLIILANVFQVSHSPLRFAMIHRHHHGHADVPGKDIHGPTMGFWETVVGWEYDLENTVKRLGIKIPKDLMRDQFLVWFDKHYYRLLFAVCAIAWLVDWRIFWYIIVPGSVWFRLTGSYFSNFHTSYFGYINHDLGHDTAKNSVFANIFTCGEGWHNNHHARPGDWRYGQKSWEWDPPQWAIKRFLGDVE